MDEQLASYEGSSLQLLLAIAAVLAGPVGALFGPVENAILERHKRLREDRLRELVRHLELDAATLEEAVRSDEGLHAIVVVIEAAQRNQSKEKQRAFAKLLSQYLKTGELERSASKFESFFSILEDLTIVELKILLVLNNFDLEQSEGRAEVWTAAKIEIGEVLATSPAEVDAYLSRLTRTGLCIYRKTWGKEVFSISPLYNQFVQYLELNNYRSL